MVFCLSVNAQDILLFYFYIACIMLPSISVCTSYKFLSYTPQTKKRWTKNSSGYAPFFSKSGLLAIINIIICFNVLYNRV